MDLFYTHQTDRNVDFWYGARSLKENVYEQDFRALDKNFSNFSYHLVLSEPTDEDVHKGWPIDDPLRTNYVCEAFKQGMLLDMEDPAGSLYYVCGPPAHNVSALTLLEEFGVDDTSVVLDDFGS